MLYELKYRTVTIFFSGKWLFYNAKRHNAETDPNLWEEILIFFVPCLKSFSVPVQIIDKFMATKKRRLEKKGLLRACATGFANRKI
jgi:hypothetical protein